MPPAQSLLPSNRIDLPVPALHSVSVVSADWEKGHHLQMDLVGGADFQSVGAAAGKDGMAVFPNIPAGECRITDWSSGKKKWTQIRVPATTHVVWRPRTGD